VIPRKALKIVGRQVVPTVFVLALMASATPAAPVTCHLDSGMLLAVTPQLAIEIYSGLRTGDRANLAAIIRGHGTVAVPAAAAARVVDSSYQARALAGSPNQACR
jgi:hypothetical protein